MSSDGRHFAQKEPDAPRDRGLRDVRGRTFCTYAVWWIEQALTGLIQGGERAVRVSGPVLDPQRAMGAVEEHGFAE